LPDDLDTTTYSRPQSRSTEEIQYPYSPMWETERKWLPWVSDGLEHGLKAHRVSPGGNIEESGGPYTGPEEDQGHKLKTVGRTIICDYSRKTFRTKILFHGPCGRKEYATENPPKCHINQMDNGQNLTILPHG